MARVLRPAAVPCQSDDHWTITTVIIIILLLQQLGNLIVHLLIILLFRCGHGFCLAGAAFLLLALLVARFQIRPEVVTDGSSAYGEATKCIPTVEACRFISRGVATAEGRLESLALEGEAGIVCGGKPEV